MGNFTRRSFVTTMGAVTLAPTSTLFANSVAPAAPAMRPARESASVYLFFNAAEAQFVETACDRLIPADESGPGALGAGVPKYLDKQLGGSWGAGERPHRSGAWQPGTPSHGVDLPLAPAELFRTALSAIRHDFESRGTTFGDLPPKARDSFLRSLEAGAVDLDGVPSAVFFDMLVKMTAEGFFSDPVYGRNRNTVPWRMIGFPGGCANIRKYHSG